MEIIVAADNLVDDTRRCRPHIQFQRELLPRFHASRIPEMSK
jgi:hypothetical protein